MEKSEKVKRVKRSVKPTKQVAVSSGLGVGISVRSDSPKFAGKESKRVQTKANQDAATGLNTNDIPNWSPPRSEWAIIREASEGVNGSRINEVAAMVDLTRTELAPILQVSERTLARIRPDDRLDTALAERVLLLENVLKYGYANAFSSNSEAFKTWLRTPLSSFNSSPVTLMHSTLGFNLVMEKLGQITFSLY